MPRRKSISADGAASNSAAADYRYKGAGETRLNNPEAGLAAQGRDQRPARQRTLYDPHLPPVLRFDPAGAADRLPGLLESAKTRPLTPSEIGLLAEALRNREPWLEWAGKQEAKHFDVDPVALHIHERVAAQAILRTACRQDVQRDLFADPELPQNQAVQFYKHSVEWSNRLILGDSLSVMTSLAKREDLAGKVQMIYIDPPYGIKYGSNFQPTVKGTTVSTTPQNLTREPEMVKAYRDTWTLGVHSYLAYLRDRLFAAKELLADSGSIFVQIGDENLHRVRAAMDEVMGAENFISSIAFSKSSSTNSPSGNTNVLASTTDYLLWFAKRSTQIKYRQIYKAKEQGSSYEAVYTRGDANNPYTLSDITSQKPTTVYNFEFQNQTYSPLPRGWRTTNIGMDRLAFADRIEQVSGSIRYRQFVNDYPVIPQNNFWADTGTGSFTDEKRYVVQTNTKVIERCLLMTTDPGDLVLDPTCGSGTTAYVAEQWGRRWITADTSRVALAIARQRLLTAKYDYYELHNPARGPGGGFFYKTVPHVTLKSIAQNQALDPVFARWQPQLAAALAALNEQLLAVPDALRRDLRLKIAAKEKSEGRRSVTDVDRRRWELPAAGHAWQEWEVPFDTDPDWPLLLRNALDLYREAWRGKMDEVNATIAQSAEQEELVDQPRVKKNTLRVSGPFTVEGVMPAELSLDSETDAGASPIPGLADANADSDAELPTFEAAGDDGRRPPPAPLQAPVAAVNADAYLDQMIGYLKTDGLRFLNNNTVKFDRLERSGGGSLLHASGEWTDAAGQEHCAAVVFGPQYGPVTAKMVDDCLILAYRKRVYTDVVFAGFEFDAAAQAVIQDDANPHVKSHLAQIRPDVNMGDLLKSSAHSQIFTVFGLPRVALEPVEQGEYVVHMEGMDVYNPLTNALEPTGADKVAAWFLDADYDNRTFCITQAFFPDKSAWEKIAKALGSQADQNCFAAFAQKTSLPFAPGQHARAAVKVIDPRGNESLRVLELK